MAGDSVTKGQQLASLTPSSLPSNIFLAQANLVDAEQALDDLLNADAQQAQALEDVETAQQALDDALNPTLKQAQALETIAAAEETLEDKQFWLDILTAPVPQTAIDQAYANMLLAKDALDDYQEEYDKIERRSKISGFSIPNLPPGVPAPKIDMPNFRKILKQMTVQLTKLQIAYDDAVYKYYDLQEPVDPVDLAVAEADVAVAKAELTEAKREWARIQNEPTNADIALLEAVLEDAQREWARLKDGPDPDDVIAAEATVIAAQAAIDMAFITAPIDALIADVETEIGDQVAAGTYAFRLDDLSGLLVEVDVSEIEINLVQVGHPVIMTLDAISDQTFQGEVIEVAPFGVEQAGVVDFRVTVEIHDPSEDVKPGMTAAVSIIVNE
jgi:HlyD family secretion protein